MKETKNKLIFADSEHCADMRYATSFCAPDPFLWCSVNKKKYVFVSPLEYQRATKECSIEITVINTTEWKKKHSIDKKISDSDFIVAVSNIFKVTEWTVPYEFPAGLLIEINSNKNKISLKPQKSFFSERKTKTEIEIKHIQDGVKLAEIGMQHAFEILKKSKISSEKILYKQKALTSEILRSEIDTLIKKNGGTAIHTIVSCARQSAEPHNIGTGILFPNQPIVIDIFPRVDKTAYWGDLSRTVVKGKASEKVKKAFSAVKDARDLSIQAVKSGIPAKNIHKIAEKTLQKHGFKTNIKKNPPEGFIHSTGHGLGLKIHELPRISQKEKYILKEGNVFTIEPGLYYQDFGGIRLEDVVVITSDGYKNLTTIETFLEIEN
ncbi:MAG: Xaa-Pro peptidase family protein [Verrucomicrobiota bacterium]|nr:Xaa-Pro peptidase family protein [Verrucomicrobiota bacterium]